MLPFRPMRALTPAILDRAQAAETMCLLVGIALAAPRRMDRFKRLVIVVWVAGCGGGGGGDETHVDASMMPDDGNGGGDGQDGNQNPDDGGAQLAANDRCANA